MKIWMDDVRKAPEGYLWAKDVDTTIYEIMRCEREVDCIYRDYILGYISGDIAQERFNHYVITEISCDNDLGEGIAEGYKLLDWLEATDRNYPIHIHTANPVARQRMKSIIKRNGWKEV
jgi:hypothetical protein